MVSAQDELVDDDDRVDDDQWYCRLICALAGESATLLPVRYCPGIRAVHALLNESKTSR